VSSDRVVENTSSHHLHFIIYQPSIQIIMSTIETVLAEISSMTLEDLPTLRKKRSARKGQFTRLTPFINEAASIDANRVNLKELKRNLADLRKHIKLHNFIQDHIESLALEDSALLTEEQAAGQVGHDEYAPLLDRYEATEERVLLYHEAELLMDELTSLLDNESLHLPVFQAAYGRLQDRITELKRKARFLKGQPEVDTLVSKVNQLATAYQTKVAKGEAPPPVAAKESTSHPTITPTVPPKSAYRSNLTLELPSFSGKPADWQPFRKLFTAVMDTVGEGIPPTEAHCHLLKAMKSDAAKRVVTNAAHSDNSYKQALVFPHYISQLMKLRKFSYDSNGLSQFREAFDVIDRGVKACEGATYSQLMAGIAFSTFDERMHDEWSHHYTKDELPKIEDVMAFFKKRQLAMKPKEPAGKPNSPKPANKPTSEQPSRRQQPVHRIEANDFKCKACNEGSHPIARCSKFRSWTVEEKNRKI